MMENTSSPTLARRLRKATGRELLELVECHGREFSIREVRQVLLNHFTTPQVIEGLLVLRHLTSTSEVRRALCCDRRTPEVAAMRFIPGLFWRDLLEIAANLRLSPAVRRLAEKYLVQRLPRLAVGERITLARRASPEVMTHLRTDADLRVIRALLENPRLTELRLLPLIAHEKTPPQVLQLVADHPRWGGCYDVRAALGCNPLTPFSVLFRILPELKRSDVQAIAAQENHSSVVRNRALEQLDD